MSEITDDQADFLARLNETTPISRRGLPLADRTQDRVQRLTVDDHKWRFSPNHPGPGVHAEPLYAAPVGERDKALEARVWNKAADLAAMWSTTGPQVNIGLAIAAEMRDRALKNQREG